MSDEDEMTLRELISKAQDDLSVYKNPDISEVKKRLTAILRAGNLGGITDDKVVSLYYAHGKLHINTEYEVRCCRQTARYEIPESVIDADNPERIMAIHCLRADIEKLRREIDSDEAALGQKRKKLWGKQTALDNLNVGTGGDNAKG